MLVNWARSSIDELDKSGSDWALAYFVNRSFYKPGTLRKQRIVLWDQGIPTSMNSSSIKNFMITTCYYVTESVGIRVSLRIEVTRWEALIGSLTNPHSRSVGPKPKIQQVYRVDTDTSNPHSLTFRSYLAYVNVLCIARENKSVEKQQRLPGTLLLYSQKGIQ